MKPAGRDRDKMIAELKGYKWVNVPPDFDGRNEGRCLFPPDMKHDDYTWPNKGKVSETLFVRAYSTDIMVAMELWEEMKRAGYIALSTLGNGEPMYCHLNTGNEIFDVEAPTEADAISGAWLKWKEGN